MARDATVAPAGRLDAGAPDGTRVAPPGLREGEANTRWLSGHPEVVEAHRGEWLCIADEQLVVAEADEALFAAKIKAYDDRPGVFIVRIPTLEELHLAHPLV
jgi:hypothetical protein